MMDEETTELTNDEFIYNKLNASMSRQELIDLIYKLRDRIKELTSEKTQSND